MTLVLIGKVLLFEGSTPKTKDKQVPGIHMHVYEVHGIYSPTIMVQ